MTTELLKRFDIEVTAAKQAITKTFELDKNITVVNGVFVTSDRDELMYYRGTQGIEINKQECVPENCESKVLMFGINVGGKDRFRELNGVAPGNGAVKVTYKDNDDGRTTFEPYRFSVYFICQAEDGI